MKWNMLENPFFLVLFEAYRAWLSFTFFVLYVVFVFVRFSVLFYF